MNLLFVLLIVVVVYELVIKFLINHKLESYTSINVLDNLPFSKNIGPYYYSISKCNNSKTPYIQADNKYICFDNTVNNIPVHTDNIFYGNEKNCIIEPNGKRITLYNSNKRILDMDTIDGTKKVKIFPTSDSYTSRIERLCNPAGVRIDDIETNNFLI
jgi:hypothetical protein